MLNITREFPKQLQPQKLFLSNVTDIFSYLTQPIRIIKTYESLNLRADVLAGLTVAVVLLPQAIAFALIAELPPEMGLYAAIVAATVGALWGSSRQLHTGPTNAVSLLVLSVLLTIATPGTSEFLIAAGMLAVMAGLFQMVMGLARLGMLVNFVSHSVIVGFSSGAGVLIALNQLRHLFGIQISSRSITETIVGVGTNLPYTHWPTALLGFGTMFLIMFLRRLNPKLPSPLISMSIASVVVFLLGLDQAGVGVIGQLPASLPPLADLPLFDLDFIARLSTGALAVGAIGLVQTTAITRSIAAQTGQRLDSNQEFVGQGLANITAGLFSGYPVSGSFTCSAVNYKAGAKTSMSGIFCSGFLLVAMFLLAPLAAYLPRAALAGVLILTAYGLIDRAEIVRIWRGTRGDAFIMLATFLGTLFLNIEFAVLLGILISFALYIMKTSAPRVYPVQPDEDFLHFVREQPNQKPCPQLGIIKISGDLYFGAVNHVEEELHNHLAKHPEQRFLLLRMHGVNQCDFSGIHMMEAVRNSCQERGGDLFFMKVQEPVLKFMKSTGFHDKLGSDHFLKEEKAISYLFHKILDPAICIYECEVRAFAECQNLPKRVFPIEVPVQTAIPSEEVAKISPDTLRKRLLREDPPPLVIDVREQREYKRGHIPQAQLIPLPQIINSGTELPRGRDIIMVCGQGRRSTRAAHLLRSRGQKNISILAGGMIAWEAAGLLEAVDEI